MVITAVRIPPAHPAHTNDHQYGMTLGPIDLSRITANAVPANKPMKAGRAVALL